MTPWEEVIKGSRTQPPASLPPRVRANLRATDRGRPLSRRVRAMFWALVMLVCAAMLFALLCESASRAVSP